MSHIVDQLKIVLHENFNKNDNFVLRILFNQTKMERFADRRKCF